jgi:hypothetical protein
MCRECICSEWRIILVVMSLDTTVKSIYISRFLLRLLKWANVLTNEILLKWANVLIVISLNVVLEVFVSFVP